MEKLHYLLSFVCIILFKIIHLNAEAYDNWRPNDFPISPQLSPTNFMKTITPEDVRFAKRRCTKLSSEDLGNLDNWMNSKELNLNEQQEHCYIKCVLQKLGLINLRTRGLEAYKITRQFEEWDSMDIPLELFDILSTPLNGTCLSYFNVWMAIRNATGDLYKKAFFEDDKSPRIYNQKHRNIAKELGIQATKYCEEKPIDRTEAAWLSVAFGYRDFKQNIEKYYQKCVFEHFHYIDAYGRVDNSEILLSLHEANKYNEANAKIVKNCSHKANRAYPMGLCEMAYVLQKCLSTNLKDYKEVLSVRDYTTINY